VKFSRCTCYIGVRSGAVGWDTALQIGRSRELSSISTVAPVGSSVGALYQKLYIQSKRAPEDGRICLPKHVGLIFLNQPYMFRGTNKRKSCCILLVAYIVVIQNVQMQITVCDHWVWKCEMFFWYFVSFIYSLICCERCEISGLFNDALRSLSIKNSRMTQT
jgi:hypothetical protein